MKKKLRNGLILLIAATLILAMVPLSAMAESEGSPPAELPECGHEECTGLETCVQVPVQPPEDTITQEKPEVIPDEPSTDAEPVPETVDVLEVNGTMEANSTPTPIAAFDALEETELTVDYGTAWEDIAFPALTSDGVELSGVAWENVDYDGNTPGEYVFTPIIPAEAYTVEDGVKLPTVTVTVRENSAEPKSAAAATGIIMPMAGQTMTIDLDVITEGVYTGYSYDAASKTLAITGNNDPDDIFVLSGNGAAAQEITVKIPGAFRSSDQGYIRLAGAFRCKAIDIANDATLEFHNPTNSGSNFVYSPLILGTGATAVFTSVGAFAGYRWHAPISGAGSIELESGELRLCAANTYTGSTTVSGNGRLIIDASSFIETSGNLVLQDSAVLDISGSTNPVTVNLASGTIWEDNTSVTLGANTLNVNVPNGYTQIRSTFSGAGGLVKQGAGDLDLYKDAGYTGKTTVWEGMLVFNNCVPNTSELEVAQGATLGLNSGVDTNYPNTLLGGGNIDFSGEGSLSGDSPVFTGTLNLYGDATLTSEGVLGSGSVVMSHQNAVLTVDHTGRFSNKVSGVGGAVFTGGVTIASLDALQGNSGGSFVDGEANIDADGTLTQKIYYADQVKEHFLYKTGNSTLTLGAGDPLSEMFFCVRQGTVTSTEDQKVSLLLVEREGTLTLTANRLAFGGLSISGRADITGRGQDAQLTVGANGFTIGGSIGPGFPEDISRVDISGMAVTSSQSLWVLGAGKLSITDVPGNRPGLTIGNRLEVYDDAQAVIEGGRDGGAAVEGDVQVFGNGQLHVSGEKGVVGDVLVDGDGRLVTQSSTGSDIEGDITLGDWDEDTPGASRLYIMGGLDDSKARLDRAKNGMILGDYAMGLAGSYDENGVHSRFAAGVSNIAVPQAQTLSPQAVQPLAAGVYTATVTGLMDNTRAWGQVLFEYSVDDVNWIGMGSANITRENAQATAGTAALSWEAPEAAAKSGYRVRTTYIPQSSSDNYDAAAATVTDISGETYVITAAAGENGSISPAGDKVVMHGGSMEYTITPNEGYLIEDVKVNGQSMGSIPRYTFTNVQADGRIEATFAAIPAQQPATHTIRATAGTGGTITPSGDVTLYEGQTATFTIAANNGYTVKDVQVDGRSVGSVGEYTFRDVDAGHTIHAEFAQNPAPTNTPAPTVTPQSGGGSRTGDNTNLWLWVAVTVIAGTGVFGAALYRKRRMKSK